mgnify:FL=1
MFNFSSNMQRFLALLLFILGNTAFAEELIQFDIKQQSVDKALIAFAKTINQTIVFPFELTQQYQANRLKGVYTTKYGLNKLLKNTPLIATMNKNGQFTIELNKPESQSLTSLTSPQTSKSRTKKASPANHVEKITILGSRISGRSIGDLPVPVDIFSAEALINTGQTEVGKMLQTIAPSFNFSSSAISDGTDAFKPATLRGLGPDQTLVLINGKRRHQASLIHINSSVGRGATGTDLNAIPIAAIKRIEVLRDGAAAQYGSDAIAGVINIVLNDNNHGGAIAASYGQYTQGDGATQNVSLSNGFSLGESGFINTSVNFRETGYTNRAGLHGTCQYDGCTTNNDGVFVTNNPSELNASRNTFRVGDANAHQIALTLNAGYQLFKGKLYGFFTYSNRENESATFFRHNNALDNPKLADTNVVIPGGYLPKINADIKDSSYNLGYKIDLTLDTSLDISYTYGKNTINYRTSDSINASFVNALHAKDNKLTSDDIRNITPRNADAYGLALTLHTLNIDFTHDFELFSFATGAELRKDGYQVKSGELYSYFDYDSQHGRGLFSQDYSAGIQGFSGIAPLSALKETRNVISLYTDVEHYLTDDFNINGALRYDNYDGFGQSTNLKLASQWQVQDNVSLRGAISTGFRAPSMQQLYFNNISTQFVSNPNTPSGDQIPIQVGTFRNDSQLAKNIGIPELTEENAINMSLGTVITFNNNINLTIDLYKINIEDRIVISDKLTHGLSSTLDSILNDSGAGAAQFFLNGADTQTTGVDLIGTWSTSLLQGTVDFTLSANFTNTKVSRLFSPSGSDLTNIPAKKVFSKQEISIIEDWQPEDRISFTSFYRSDHFTAQIAFNRYGEYTIIDGEQQTYGAKTLTDIRLNYFLTPHLSFNLGGNNIFDVYPDKNNIGNSRAGKIIDSQGNMIVDSSGIFTYSRRSAPFGFNGAYYYAGIEYQF